MNLTRNIIIMGIILLVTASPSAYCTPSVGFDNTNNTTFDSKETVVLVTGFEPFNIYDINPSQLIAETLNGEYINGICLAD